MRDSRAHVEAPGGRPQGRLIAVVRDHRGGRVRISRGHLHRLLRRYREAGLTPSSRAPAGRTPARTGPPTPCASRIVALRTELTARGLDAGPAPSRGTSGARVFPSLRPRPSGASSTPPAWSCPSHASARAAPGGASRPRAQRGLAVRCHPLAPRRRHRGRDHQLARRPLPVPARLHRLRRVTGDDVVATFTAAGDAHGWPAATLTDNGSVYTSRFTGGRNSFEYLLACLGSARRTGRPATPRPRARSSASTRPSSAGSAGGRRRPTSPGCRPSSTPSGSRTTSSGRTGPSGDGRPARLPGDTQGPARRLPCTGPLPPALRRHRRQGRHDPAPGRPDAPPQGRRGHARRRVLALIDEQEVTVVALDTGEILSTHRIEPDRGYWRNQRRDPGRWPGSRADRLITCRG